MNNKYKRFSKVGLLIYKTFIPFLLYFFSPFFLVPSQKNLSNKYAYKKT